MGAVCNNVAGLLFACAGQIVCCILNVGVVCRKCWSLGAIFLLGMHGQSIIIYGIVNTKFLAGQSLVICCFGWLGRCCP